MRDSASLVRQSQRFGRTSEHTLALAALAVVLAMSTPSTGVLAQSRLDGSVVGAGVTQSASGTYALRGTLAQPAPGSVNAGDRVIQSGFWYTLSGVFPLVVFADLRVFLEGPYVPSQSMHALANNVTPESQPYGNVRFAETPSFYEGDESVDSLDAGVVDWVLVELRSDTSRSSIVASRAALLMTDGFVRDTDGTSPVRFDEVPSGSYFVVVRHGNHLPVMTASAITLDRRSEAYDFSSDLARAFGANPMKEMESGVYALFGGDADQDGLIETRDLNEYLVSTTGGITGYVSADYNRDGQVTARDFNIFLANSSAGVLSLVPDGTVGPAAKTAVEERDMPPDASTDTATNKTRRFPWERDSR